MAGNPPLVGKVALVTGAAQGMGASQARRLAASGASVAVNDLDPSPALDSLAQEIGGIAAPGDVSNGPEVQRLVAGVQNRLGPVDVLVANHAYMSMAALVDCDPTDWWKVVH